MIDEISPSFDVLLIIPHSREYRIPFIMTDSVKVDVKTSHSLNIHLERIYKHKNERSSAVAIARMLSYARGN